MGVAERDNELDTELQNEEVTEEQVEETGTEEGTEESGEGEDDEVVVQIGDEESPASEEVEAAPKWVKDLRAEQKRLKRELADARAKLAGTGQPATQQTPTLPEFPKIADYDYDEEKYQEAVTGWNDTKREVEAHEKSQQEAANARQKAVQAVHENYATSKKALKVPDYQDAEDEAVAALDTVQQSILIAGAENPGAMVYALGKNPKKLAELASIKDPVKFAVAIGNLQRDIKVTKRTSTKPAPESTVRGGSGAAPATSATLERLEAEAAKTGDRSKVIAYKRQQRSGK